VRTELDPEIGPPPRNVQPWTHVAGHEVIRRPPGRSFCSCGHWSYEGPGNHRAEVDEHIRTAWPILVPRLAGETRSDWRNRVARAHEEALLVREGFINRDGLDQPTRPGASFPLLSVDFSNADDVVTVLEWQLKQIRPEMDFA